MHFTVSPLNQDKDILGCLTLAPQDIAGYMVVTMYMYSWWCMTM